jgi:dTDP-4-amino-4,6-dideoxygalactose transaminase
MRFPFWWKGWVKTNHSPKGLLVQVALDLILSNLGLFMGTLTTVGIWAFTWTETSRSFFHQMVFEVWLTNTPMLTACCLFAYSINGLYREAGNGLFTGKILEVIRAVGTACLLFLFWIYMTETFMPRSTISAGWFFIFVLILSTRLFLTAFFRQYHLVKADAHNAHIDRINRELAVIFQQDGWLPPESLPREAAWPHFEEDEILAAAAVLKSGKINQWTGKEIEKFQEEFAAACGMKHAIALANGTVALELALRVSGIGPGDEVVITPRTFIASASCAVLQGATPVFADVDRESQNMTATSIRKVLSPRTKAIIAVHLAGWPGEMEAIMTLAAERGLIVIEDCAQAHGARYRGRPVGSFGHAAAFSFCQDKIMTTGGEGGMFLTNDDALWSAAWAFKDHGKDYESVYYKEHPPGFRWLHESFGTNWRMTEMQAAIGRVQLGKLEKWVHIRRRNANILTERFSKLGALRLTVPPPDVFHSYYKYYVFVRPERLKPGWDRDRIMNTLSAEGVPCFSGSCSEIYMEKAFEGNGLRPAERLPVAKELGETSLMFLVHPTLTEQDMKKITDGVEKIISEATIG